MSMNAFRNEQRTSPLMVIVAFLLMVVFASANADEAEFAEAVGELSTKLELDEDQSKKLGSSIQAYMKQLDTLFAEQEGEDADPAKLIEGVRDAQAGYEEELASFMSKEQFNKYQELKEQFNKYQELKEQAIKRMLGDLAEIQLLNAQPKTSITDEQITELAPVLGNSFYGILKIAFENAGKKLRPRQKIGVAKKLKSIQSNAQKELQRVLTPEQLQAWEAHKAEKSG
ncbi:MAG: hypothetical protein GY785_15080 [Gammaproteobacteria bacterium]|nr:hypothetical protein [Gammaproteobacteria bacterium]